MASDNKGLAPGDSLERSVLYWNGIRSVLQMRKLEAHSKLVDNILTHADEALYKAKAAGRNTVCCADVNGRTVCETSGEIVSA